MNLSELQKEAHAIAVAHGWWDEERTFGDLIALVHSELSEALEAYREQLLESWVITPSAHVEGDSVVTSDEVDTKAYPVRIGSVPETKYSGVAFELADVVIRVADMAEHYGYSLDPDESIEDWDALDVCLAWLGSFGDWIAQLHWITAEPTSYKVVASEHLVINALASLIVGVQRMTAHYGIDLDAAIEAKMEYNRTRSYRHGGKAL